ncbi:MAG: cytochrome c [Acidimicrobiia bacterium]|nr:cytochrome c [Acidimicrobiia bacterium]
MEALDAPSSGFCHRADSHRGCFALARRGGCTATRRRRPAVLQELLHPGRLARAGPDLTNVLWQSEVSDSDLDRIIRSGVRGTAMPAFGDQLDACARQDLVRHIRTLTAYAITPTAGSCEKIIEKSLD